MYQRTIKIYQGVDNTIELDIKNVDQKRIPITSYVIKVVIMDVLNQEIYTATANVATGMPGIASVVIPATALTYILPQFLKFSVYILNIDNTKTPLYNDTYSGMSGTIELLAGAIPAALPTIVLDTFNPLSDTVLPIVRYYSEAALVNPPNDILATSTISLDFTPVSLDATITVQITEEGVVSESTIWRDVETFTVSTATSTVTKTYTNGTDFQKTVSWLRIVYVRADENSGTLDKVVVRM